MSPSRSALSQPRSSTHIVKRSAGAFGWTGLVVVIVVGLVVLITALSSFDKTNGGEVAVIRNGGPFDNNKVRQVIQPASSLTWTGVQSASHKYPSQQRFYTITSDPRGGDKAGVDVENDPTSDGVDVGIEGTVYFSLNLDDATLRVFDDKYGTRSYRGADGQQRHAWDGDNGWSSFLDQIVRPVISNDLRQEIGDYRCAELQAACALVQNGGSSQVGSTTAAGSKSNVNISKIQDAINTSLAADLKTTLGGDFITGVRFNLVKITLPATVQDAINKAQAAFAGVTEAQARIAQATADAKANEQRQLGYVQCPACAEIDKLKAIPPSITVYAPGANTSVPLVPLAAQPAPAKKSP